MTVAKYLLRHLKGNPDWNTEHTVGNLPRKGCTAVVGLRQHRSMQGYHLPVVSTAVACWRGSVVPAIRFEKEPIDACHTFRIHMYTYTWYSVPAAFPLVKFFSSSAQFSHWCKKKKWFCYCRKIPGRPVLPARVNVGGNAVNSVCMSSLCETMGSKQ